jgi:hypothetical protein
MCCASDYQEFLTLPAYELLAAGDTIEPQQSAPLHRTG